MQSVFIKTNWPGELQKDTTELFLVFLEAPTISPISTFPFQVHAQKWETVTKPCDETVSLNQNNLKKVNLLKFVLLTLVQVNNDCKCRQNILVQGQQAHTFMQKNRRQYNPQ